MDCMQIHNFVCLERDIHKFDFRTLRGMYKYRYPQNDNAHVYACTYHNANLITSNPPLYHALVHECDLINHSSIYMHKNTTDQN